MLFSRDSQRRPKNLPISPDVRRWAVRFLLFLSGAVLILTSPSHQQYRRLELVLGGALLLGVLANVAIDILLTVAAKTVKPRQLGND